MNIIIRNSVKEKHRVDSQLFVELSPKRKLTSHFAFYNPLISSIVVAYYIKRKSLIRTL